MTGERTEVKWKWGKGGATGKVGDVFEHEITTTIKGSKITKKGNLITGHCSSNRKTEAKYSKLESEMKCTD